MANRSYLYASNHFPGTNAEKESQSIIGISEWEYDIPLIYKLLLAGNPRVCHSSIWDEEEPIALLGDYAAGVNRLKSFFTRIHAPLAQPLIKEAIEFLETPSNQKKYFLLECGEIFDMEDQALSEQNLHLLQQINTIDGEVSKTLDRLQPPALEKTKPVGFLAKIFGSKSTASSPKNESSPTNQITALEDWEALGLNAWSNILYYKPK